MNESIATVTQSTPNQNPLVDASTNSEIDRLGDLASNINEKQRQINNHQADMINLAAETGVLLTKAKAQVKHGEWSAWVDANTCVGRKQASKYMKLSDNEPLLSNVPSTRHLTSIDSAISYIASEKKRLDAPKSVKAKSSPEVETPAEQYTVDDEGVEGFSLDEACDAAGEDCPKRTDKLGDVSNDTSAVETDDEPSDDTTLFDESQARGTHTIDGDYTKVDSAATDVAEAEKQKKHAAAESKPSGPIQESKSTPNKAERELATKRWEAAFAQVDIAACKYVPILDDKIGKDLMELALKFEK